MDNAYEWFMRALAVLVYGGILGLVVMVAGLAITGSRNAHKVEEKSLAPDGETDIAADESK